MGKEKLREELLKELSDGVVNFDEDKVAEAANYHEWHGCWNGDRR